MQTSDLIFPLYNTYLLIGVDDFVIAQDLHYLHSQRNQQRKTNASLVTS